MMRFPLPSLRATFPRTATALRPLGEGKTRRVAIPFAFPRWGKVARRAGRGAGQ